MAYIGNTLRTAQPNYQIIDDISASFDGSTTTFALQVGGVTPAPFPVNAQHCLISVGGVVQQPDPTGTDGFLLSGSNIVFSAAPSAGENFFGVVLAGADYINVGAEFPDGSVATPSITFDQDTDTGLYRKGTNNIAITTNGTERASVGTSEVVFNDGGADINFRIEGDTESNLFFVDAGNNRVGIGTSVPQSLLECNDSANDLQARFGTLSAARNPIIRLQGRNAANTQNCFADIKLDSENQLLILADPGTTGGSIGENPVVIDSSGNVGVGTTSPADILHVEQSSGAAYILSRSTTNGVQAFFGASNGGVDIGSTSNDILRFYTNNAERMTIAQQGRVGINDNTGGYAELLQITGSTSNQYALALKVGTTSNAFHVRFADTTGVIGSITSSAGTVAYNPFLGCHWARLENGEKIEVPVGTIIETVDKEIEWNFAVFDSQGETKKMAWNGSEKPGETVEVSYEGNTYTATIEPESVDPNVLNKHVCVKVNDTPNSPAVFGVFFGQDSDEGSTDFIGSWNDFYVAAVGNYFIRIAAQETVQIGDLISSDGTGCGVIQGTDAITSKTVAKVTSTKKHAVYEDGSYLVTCVLCCG